MLQFMVLRRVGPDCATELKEGKFRMLWSTQSNLGNLGRFFAGGDV